MVFCQGVSPPLTSWSARVMGTAILPSMPLSRKFRSPWRPLCFFSALASCAWQTTGGGRRLPSVNLARIRKWLAGSAMALPFSFLLPKLSSGTSLFLLVHSSHPVQYRSTLKFINVHGFGIETQWPRINFEFVGHILHEKG
jgi:hypothetical protein